MSYRPITDTIFCARTKTKDPSTGKSYYGAYPAGFLEKARIILGCSDSDVIWHVCGGFAREYNGIKGGINLTGFGSNDLSVDLDHSCQPDILGDVRNLHKFISSNESNCLSISYNDEIKKHFTFRGSVLFNGDPILKPKGIIIDRPYTLEDARHYRFGESCFPDLNKLLKDCLKIVRPSGLVGVLDYMIPSSSNGKCIGLYGVVAGTNCRIRAFTVWQKCKETSHENEN